MAVIGEMHYLTIGNNTYSIPVSGGGGGTVTSVRVQATSPVQSSSSSEQTVSLDTTISLADAYGDTKNPYGTKTANYVLAGPTSGSSRVPSFRQLVAADIPDLSASYLPASTTIPTKTSDLTNDSNFITDASYVHTDNNYTSTEKTKLSGIAEGAEVNQNAFSTVKVGSTSLTADSKTDTLTITAGNNITLTPTASSDSFTIAATDTTYSDVVAGGTSGLMTGADKTKLNGIASGAEVNVQANWNETSSSSDAYIQNKPTINKSTVSSTAPSGGTAGDLWFKIVT